jgi:hypothetical protein
MMTEYKPSDDLMILGDEINRLRAENAELLDDNFALAAGQCNNIVGDEGGSPVCKEVRVLREKNDNLQGIILAAYNMAVNHDDRFPFDWAILCEMLYQALNKESK